MILEKFIKNLLLNNMKKVLLIVLIIMSCYSLSDLLFNHKEEISEVVQNIESGSYVGYSVADCV